MEKKKGIAAEFKEFIARGNVMDMAVGIIMGSAFTAIVKSLVDDVLMPVIGILFGGVDFTSLKVVLRAADEAAGIEEAALRYGSFIQNIVSFLLIAVVIFLMVKGMNKLRRKKEEPAPAPAPAPEPSEEVKLLTEIRDALKK
ncbi:MAG: large-conductance mechanosensitive channel protein MscL [Clostridia bacterium]|nr:large-conductance mechanosensitive channel protein MscL [Clostridia bacterium]